MVELVDAADSKSAGGNSMRVQVPPSAKYRRPFHAKGFSSSAGREEFGDRAYGELRGLGDKGILDLRNPVPRGKWGGLTIRGIYTEAPLRIEHTIQRRRPVRYA